MPHYAASYEYTVWSVFFAVGNANVIIWVSYRTSSPGEIPNVFNLKFLIFFLTFKLFQFSDMNYKNLFSTENIAAAVFCMLRNVKYKKLNLQSLTDVKNSKLTQHYRNKNNFWKDVSRFVVNRHSKELHRFTSKKYAIYCYHEFRNKEVKIEKIFNAISSGNGKFL